MLYRHVQQRNAKFVWRLTILGEALRNVDPSGAEHAHGTPTHAAYAADLIKYFLRQKYGLTGSKVAPSLPADKFEDMAERNGLDLNSASAVFDAMPWRAREFVKDADPLLKEQGDRDKACAAAPSSGYLQTLLVALPKRLTEALSVVQKAGQLKEISDEKRAGLAGLSLELERFEAKIRAESTRILALP